MIRKSLGTLLVAGVVAGISSAAMAAPITFFGLDQNPGGIVPAGGNAETARNSFLSNLTSVGTEDFEGIVNGTPDPFVLNFPGSSGNLTATLSSMQTVTVTNANPVGQYSTSGSQHLDADFGTTVNIDFSSTPISAFGFYGTDISDSGGDLVVDLTDAMNVVTSFTVVQNGQNSGSLLFWGFVDNGNSYTQISLRNTSSSDRFGFDDMTIGDQQQVIPMPEPASLGLLGLGLAGLGIAARRRKNA